MESEKRLSLSCETYAMLKTPYFMSAFPSYILFGLTHINISYERNSVFEISFSEAYKLLVNIFYIGSFFMSELDSSNGLILEKPNEKYIWSGIVVIRNDKIEKVVKFGIEKQSQITFEICFFLEEFNNFIYLFKRCIVSCLCLKEFEEQFIVQTATNQTCETIVKAKTDLKIAKMIIDSFYEHSGYEKLLNNSSLIEMLNYYNETILIVKQLHTLFTPMDDNSALILANID